MKIVKILCIFLVTNNVKGLLFFIDKSRIESFSTPSSKAGTATKEISYITDWQSS